ncbi:MAG: GNAT family N-acetyltransferase [Anaerolineae bacterium]|nr:GNAT family N-acetyltransferase [Anaerolineae bacterium]
MDRRLVDVDRDYEQLLAMQRRSWEINFPGELFYEAAFMGSLRSSARRGQVYVYEMEGSLVGWLWLDLSPSHDHAHIRHIQVEEAYWGQGIGKAIVEDAIAICAQRRREEITLNVTKANERAMALYAGLGFVLDEDDGARQRMRLTIGQD